MNHSNPDSSVPGFVPESSVNSYSCMPIGRKKN